MKKGNILLRDIHSNRRFDGSFHLSDAVIYERIIKKGNYELLGNLTDRIFTAGRSKRIYTTKENGLPYLSNSDVISQNPFEGCKYVSRKYSRDNNALLKQGMIVTGRVGAIGQTSFISSEYEEKVAMGSDNIIRIIVNPSALPGYLYAYLVSKFGNSFLWKIASGGVQPYISEPALLEIPVPQLSNIVQKEINKLIEDASALRVQANKMWEKLKSHIESNFHLPNKEKCYYVNIKSVLKGDKFTKESRLEADFYQPQSIAVINEILTQEWSYIGDLAKDIHRSGLRERKFTKNGIPLITGQNLNLNRFGELKKLSRKFTRNIEKNITKEHEILISVQGTIGKIEYSLNNIYQGVFASEQLTKVLVNKEKVHPGYIYAFLNSKLGQIQLQKHKTGSVIEWIIENNIASIVIPIPSDKGLEIGKKVDELTLLRQKAYKLESKAIIIIEKEIESWQN